MLGSLFIVALVCVSALAWQRFHYDFLRETREWKDNAALGAALEKRLKDFDELKSKVDGLALRVGMGR